MKTYSEISVIKLQSKCEREYCKGFQEEKKQITEQLLEIKETRQW